MSTIASTSPTTRNSLLRLSVMAGLICGAVDMIIFHWFIQNILGGVPLILFYGSPVFNGKAVQKRPKHANERK